ncbi:MAG TPA: hypothetical protein VGH16_11380 [Candidatus Binatia bacterium]
MDSNPPSAATALGVGQAGDLSGELRRIKSETKGLAENLSWSRWIGEKNLAASAAIAFTFVDASNFRANDDLTASGRNVATVGRRVKAIVTAGTIYGTISAAVYSAPNTTVTVSWDSGALDSGLSEVMFGPELRAIPPLVTKLWIPAAGTNNATPSPAYDLPATNAPVASAYGTSPNKFGALDHADGANPLTAQFTVRLPDDWTPAQGVDIRFFWFSGSTSTNSVVWTCATKSIAEGEDVLNPTFNGTQTVAKANKGTANQLNTATITGLDTTGFAAGELAIFRVGRDPTNGSDTLAATASLIGCEVTLRRQP